MNRQYDLQIKLKDGSYFRKDTVWGFDQGYYLRSENVFFKEGYFEGLRWVMIPLDHIVKIERRYGTGNVWIKIWEASK
jgi:hypothetical protein